MKDLFATLLNIFNYKENITEAIMYAGCEFSRICLENESGKYTITISKEKETDGNS